MGPQLSVCRLLSHKDRQPEWPGIITAQQQEACEILGSHDGEYED
jgi:hypothetical protein